VKLQVLVLPLASVAVLVTVVTPTGKVLPLAGRLTRFVTPQLSVAFAVNVTLLRLQWPASAVSTRSVGHVITGFSSSVTVTVKVQVLVLSQVSVAVLVTVVTPTGNVLPLAGLLTRFVTPPLSVAATTKVKLLRLHCPKSAWSTKLLGQVIAGG
jgi:hypothetical protein